MGKRGEDTTGCTCAQAPRCRVARPPAPCPLWATPCLTPSFGIAPHPCTPAPKGGSESVPPSFTLGTSFSTCSSAPEALPHAQPRALATRVLVPPPQPPLPAVSRGAPLFTPPWGGHGVHSERAKCGRVTEGVTGAGGQAPGKGGQEAESWAGWGGLSAQGRLLLGWEPAAQALSYTSVSVLSPQPRPWSCWWRRL